MSRERSVIDEFNIERQIQRLWEYAGLNTKTMALVQDQCHGLRSLQLHSQEWMDNQVEAAEYLAAVEERAKELEAKVALLKRNEEKYLGNTPDAKPRKAERRPSKAERSPTKAESPRTTPNRTTPNRTPPNQSWPTSMEVRPPPQPPADEPPPTATLSPKKPSQKKGKSCPRQRSARRSGAAPEKAQRPGDSLIIPPLSQVSLPRPQPSPPPTLPLPHAGGRHLRSSMERSNETLQDLVHHFAPLGPPPEAPSQDRIPLLLPPQDTMRATHAKVQVQVHTRDAIGLPYLTYR
eukprot:CAMPEP_0174312926 /NCGR_PEP_ID=MMETSP0810-20121108/4627_1 /TAXON_ID=73025 ORGANISM="Eutreptiella gymnastica-like, Strain CCMP1594" /NCGR_SAMPLE_ID=MMETSP0810 /ASSEMBLY_ACC=CAM_ASM_000659 /LENGTH=291 /DNA_ID=CAMNT_0015421505 /DNA_START=15 /DNA_END=890 /DNA_ORIENTATION=-